MKFAILAILGLLAIGVCAQEEIEGRELRNSKCKRWDRKCCNCVDDCDEENEDEDDKKEYMDCYKVSVSRCCFLLCLSLRLFDKKNDDFI